MALSRRPRVELPWFEPADLQATARANPGKSGLVELVGTQGSTPGIAQAIANVVARHPDRLWGARIDVTVLPRTIKEFREKHGMSPEEFCQALPAVGLIRGERIFSILSPNPLFFRGPARQRSLTEQVLAFAEHFAVDYTPK